MHIRHASSPSKRPGAKHPREGQHKGSRPEWAVETRNLSFHWSVDTDSGLQLVGIRTPGLEGVSIPTPVIGVSGDTEPTLHVMQPHYRSDADGDAILSGVLEPSGISWTSRWMPYPDESVIHATFRVSNETEDAIDIGALTSLRFTIPADREATAFSVLSGGRWDEPMPPRGYRLQTFDTHTINRHWFGSADDGRSSGEFIPWFALHTPEGGLFAGLVWSGRWRLNVTRTAQGLMIDFGLADFVSRLAPGESVELPELIVAGFAGSLDAGANGWKRWLRTHWAPPLPSDWPWVQYNHWYAYYGDIDADRLFAEAQLAAEVGAEVFVIDDGWFRGRRADSYFLGWGDWVEDRTKFPEGIKHFSHRIHDSGMKFGIWMEPERIDHTGALANDRPGWIATRDGMPIFRHGRDGEEGVHLCLGSSAVQEWMIAEVVRVVHDYGVDWLKWDYNMGYGLGCNDPNHGHQAGDGHYAHTQGIYRVLAAIREACPNLVIENCASGGHRIDLGMLRHTHTSWVSDYTHRAASCRQHSQGAGLFLPQEHVNTWVLERRNRFEFLSRMGGAFGFSSHLGRWSPNELAGLADAIAVYREIRPTLYGDRFLLTGPWHQNWEVWQFLHPEGDRAALLIFRDGGAIHEITVALCSEPGKHWRLETGQSVTDRGYAAIASVTGNDLHVRLDDRQDALVVWLREDH